MKKTLLLLFLSLSAAGAFAQSCVRDSNLLQTGGLLSPAPYTPDSPFYNLAPACITLPYNQSVTINVPGSFSGFPIDSVGIPIAGAVSNLPAGISYSCDPPNCIFKPLTLGCILLHGTVSASNMPDTVDLGITAIVYTALIDLPVTFPGQVAPGSHYYLPVRTAANCMSGTGETGAQLASVRNFPNPFTCQTTIEVQARSGGDYLFEVYDLPGRRIYTEKVQIVEGKNTFTFDAGDLQPGTYYYTLGNREGKVTRLLSVN